MMLCDYESYYQAERIENFEVPIETITYSRWAMIKCSLRV